MLNIAIPLKSQPSRLSSLWMLFFMVLVAVPLAVIVNWRRGVVQEHAAARRLAELGGKINSLDGFYYKMGWLLPPNCDYQITGYASGYVGEQYPVTAEVLTLLVQLPNMHTLQLSGEKQAAFSAAPLRGLSQLK